MKLKKRNVFIGITSFLIVLFTMPLGHALMILMEHLMEPVTMHYATFFMGLIGLIMVITGVFAKGDTRQLFGNYSEVCYFGQDGLNSFMCITHIGSEYSHS